MRTLQMQALHVRDSDNGTLTLEGLAVPYGTAVDYAGISERFAPDAFDADAVTGSPLLWAHQRDEPIGHITAALNEPEGLRVEAVIQPTTRGRDAATLLRSGSVRGLSVGFEPLEWSDGTDGFTYTRAKLHELSITPLPAYPDAQVTATRQKEDTVSTTTEEAPVTVDLAPVMQRMDQLEARMSAPPPAPARTLSVREALGLQLADAKKGKLRALADVISSGNSGVLPQAWSSEVRNTLDGQRYMFPRVGSVPFPAAGFSLAVPKVLTHTTVGPRGAEKTEIPSSALTTGQDFYTATWYAGGVDIALELVLQSDPAILAVVVDDLLSAYAIVTDTALTRALETRATPAGSTLDTTSYGAFAADIVTTGEQIRAATGAFGDMLSVTTASWKKIIGFVDTQGRRILATGGAVNSDGSAQLTAGSVDVGGITVFHNPRAAEDMQYNTKSARVAEKPPLQVSSDNVALMGRDFGILGAFIDLPLYPAGIVVHSATTRAAKK